MHELTQQELALASGGIAPALIYGAWGLAVMVSLAIQAHLSSDTQNTQRT